MGARAPLLLLGLAVLTAGAVLAAAGMAGPAGPLAAAAIAGGVVAALALGLDRLVMRPVRRLARGVRSVLESRSSDIGLVGTGGGLLGALPEAIDGLVTTLQATRREGRKAAEAEAARVDGQKAWLEAILQSLSEGVFVCNRQHRILLYNSAAVALTDAPDRIGLGRGLGDVLALAPLRHGLARLEASGPGGGGGAGEGTSGGAPGDGAPSDGVPGDGAPADGVPVDGAASDGGGSAGEEALSAPFVCTSADRTRIFHGRMALLRDRGGTVTGYLVTIVDISEELQRLARGDGVRRALNRDLRAMVGNLRAAAETMVAYPQMASEDREAFERVVLDESERITQTLDELGRAIAGHLLGRWPMADVFVTDLVKCLEQNLEGSGIRVTLVGVPLWLHGDSLSLIEALEALVRRLAADGGPAEIDIEPLLGDRRVYLDLVWLGDPVPQSVLEGWLDEAVGEGTGGQTLRDILDRHGSEPWSRAAGREGHALLRLPLIAPDRPQFAPERPRLPARPEFYDFDLLRTHLADTVAAGRSLHELAYVVFDCEMTGLQPLRGDEIIQIGAVRVVQGRILTGESFERLVNPGRPIPPASIKFHGLTDADVAGKPPLPAVLPAFRDFVGDAVMVGHNVAFDMKFLTLRQREAGVAFDGPVLDTMLVSKLLDGEEEDHSLDGLCARYGIAITGRHTALGDTIATAELMLKLFDRLEAQGLTRFGEVMRAANMAAELRHRSAVVGRG